MQGARRRIARVWQRFTRTRPVGPEEGVSTDYAPLEKLDARDLNGWRSRATAKSQHEAFAPLVEAARVSRPRQDFVVAAQAIETTGLADPLVVEVGCGSGYYSEVLPMLLGHPVRYIGVDYAPSMTTLAHRVYPEVPLVTGDACHLPLKTECCDILLSGTSLMHIADYGQAIAESVRVSRQWCIFHTVPVMANRATTFLRKRAYGEPVIEVIFNQAELEALFTANGLVIHQIFESIPYDLSAVLGERTWTLTYLCRKECQDS